ncbi:phasin family protein [Aquicoccus sp. SCR17]|nr:phasin family protein [Carideicomes alvinocaridis]
MSRIEVHPPTTPEPAEKMMRISWDFSKWMGRDLLDIWLDIGSELQDFIAERIREDVKTQHRILHCHTPAALQHIQAEFLQKALDDYAAETGKLVELGNRLMTPKE